MRVGDLYDNRRRDRGNQRYRRYMIGVVTVAVLACGVVLGLLGAYHSQLFEIKRVTVSGVEHLTSEDMQALAAVEEGETLLRVDTGAIRNSLLRDAWVDDVVVRREFPDTLAIDVTERTVAAVVEVPTQDATDTKAWAIASDGMWLMPIPKAGTEAASKTSAKVYEDAANVLHITDVPYGTQAQIGTYCSDANVSNALAVVDGLTTQLADRVVSVQATDPESTTLSIEDGPDIVVGTAENIREKERVAIEIMAQHPEGVAYINVRTVDRPTWRAL